MRSPSRVPGNPSDAEQRYRRLLEAVVDHAYHVRVENGQALETIQGADCEALTGYTPQEFAADPKLWEAMVPLEDRALVEEQAVRLLSGQDAPPIEHRIRLKDGQVRWLKRTLVPQHDGQGRLIAYDGLVRDVTEFAAALRASEERYRFESDRSAAEATALGRLNEACARLWRAKSISAGLDEMLAATTDLLAADKGNIQLLDATKGVLLIVAQRGFQQDFLDFFAEVSATDDAACGRALRAGERTVIEDVEVDEAFAPFRSVARAAGYRAVQSTPLLSRNGSVLGMLSTHFRSPRRLSEHELHLLDLYAQQAASFIEHCRATEIVQRSEERLRLFIEYAPAAIAMLDTQMHYMAASQRWLADYGLVGQQLHGRNHYEVFPEIPERWKEVHRRCLKGAVEQCEEDVFVRADGSEQWLHWEVRPWRTASDIVGGIIIFTEDITARKAAEQQLRQREAELAHAQRLYTLGELAAGLAHELAQPLEAIGNEVGACVRFVQNGHLEPSKLLAVLERAANSAERAGQVLHHLRQLVERRPADFQAVDLRVAVSSAVDFIRKGAAHRKIRLRLKMEQRPLHVTADRVQIEQVLVNLLRNAIEAIDAAGGERREIAVTCKRGAAGNAEVAVHDTGPGLAKEERARLFEPFFTTKPQGLGMGLAISRRIIESHAGHIGPDRGGDAGGTTIRFTLPLTPRAAGVRAKRSAN